MHRRDRPCGNPNCSTSTGIHEGLTFGSGKLDAHGFWEFPCRTCAAFFEAQDKRVGYHLEHPELFPYWPYAEKED